MLREDKNARIERIEGRKRRRWSTPEPDQYEFSVGKHTGRTYKRVLLQPGEERFFELQRAEPIRMMWGDGTQWWWYLDRFWKDTENLNAADVQALVLQRELKKQKTLERAREDVSRTVSDDLEGALARRDAALAAIEAARERLASARERSLKAKAAIYAAVATVDPALAKRLEMLNDDNLAKRIATLADPTANPLEIVGQRMESSPEQKAELKAAENEAAELGVVGPELVAELNSTNAELYSAMTAMAEEVQAARAGDTSITRPRREPIAEAVRHEVWRRDEGRCVDCGSRERLEFDHIIPVSQGGSNTARNLELRCETCNRRKGATI